MSPTLGVKFVMGVTFMSHDTGLTNEQTTISLLQIGFIVDYLNLGVQFADEMMLREWEIPWNDELMI